MDCYVARVMKTKFPNTVMVFGVISFNGDVMPPHIFETGLGVNTEIYLQVMETVVLPRIKQVAWDRLWVWQQDSVPCHVSKYSLTWLEEHCYNFVTKDKWPSSSLDLNSMDYFFWGILENQTNQCPHTIKASLIASIKEQCISIDREMVKNACRSFRTRIECIIEAEGNYDRECVSRIISLFCFLFEINIFKIDHFMSF